MSHWYDSKGELHQYVPNASKPDTLRPATLRDARKFGWWPSTTTKLQMLNKFLLNEWIKKETIKLTIKECLNYGQIYTLEEHQDEVLNAVLKKSDEVVSWSANFGTRVHKSVSALFGGEPYEEPELDELDLVIADNVINIPTAAMMAEYGDYTKVKAVAEATKKWMDANGFECLDTEKTIVVKELGIAGTPDWIGFHYGVPCVVDVKTQDAESTKDFHLWEEFPLQLADYTKALCCSNYKGWESISPEKEEVERISVLTSRTNPGVVYPHQWSDPNDFVKMDMITEYWFLDKKYDPRKF